MDDDNLSSFINKCLSDFRCKPRDQPIENCFRPQSGPFFRSTNFLFDQHSIDLFRKSPSSSIGHSKSERSSPESITSRGKKRQRNDDSDEGEEENSNKVSSVKWCVSLYSHNRSYINKKELVLRVTCDHYGMHKWNTFLQLAHCLIVNIRLPGFVLMKNFLSLLYKRTYKNFLDDQDIQNAMAFIWELFFIMEERFELMLELVMFMLQSSDHYWLLQGGGRKFIQDLQRRNQNCRKNAHPFEKCTRSLQVLMLTFRIYDEYMEYIQWKTYSNPIDKSSVIRMNKIKTNFHQIMLQANCPELNLDIVALILMELHSYDDELPDALAMIRDYAEKFPDNLNGHVYLYEFLSKYHDMNYDYDLKIQTLKHIVRLSPNSKYTLQYVSQPENGLTLLERIEMLCNYLDYVPNRQSRKAWKLLYQQCKQTMDEDETIKLYHYFHWRLRYWEQLHFRMDVLETILPRLHEYKRSRSQLQNESIWNTTSSSGLSSGGEIILDDDRYDKTFKQFPFNRREYHLYKYKAKFLEQLNQQLKYPNLNSDQQKGLIDKHYPKIAEYKNCIWNLSV